MIKNEKQYRITQAQAKKFRETLETLARPKETRETVHPTLQKAYVDALQSQLVELEEQIREYEAIASGGQKVLELESIADLPRILIKARIASNMTQKDLAKRLGLKEQQIQRYEATDYASASFQRTMEIVNALGLKIHEDVFLPEAKISPSWVKGMPEVQALPAETRQKVEEKVAEIQEAAKKKDRSTLKAAVHGLLKVGEDVGADIIAKMLEYAMRLGG